MLQPPGQIRVNPDPVNPDTAITEPRCFTAAEPVTVSSGIGVPIDLASLTSATRAQRFQWDGIVQHMANRAALMAEQEMDCLVEVLRP